MNPDFTKVEALFDSGIAGHVYSAGAIMLGQYDQILFEKASGTVSYEPMAHAVTRDTRFDMASCSKILGPTMTALQLIEEGKLCLADYLTDFFDDVPDDKKGITVFHLMTHTSGIPAEIFLWKECKTPDDALDVILHTPLAYPTGTNVTYSCMGYITLGKIIEKVTGMPLNEAAKQYVFDPLGMTSTSYHPVDTYVSDGDDAFTELKSHCYEHIPGIVHDENARFLNGISGNAGVFSSLADMGKFCAMLSKKGAPLLTKRMMEIASVNYTPGLSENRGLGFQLSGPTPTFFGDLFGNKGIGHTGFTGTSIAVDPDTGFWVVLLTNRVYPSRSEARLMRLRHQIHNAAMAVFFKDLD